MQIAALIPLGLFVCVLVSVGIRLLILARQTRELPELALGSGLILLALFGAPLSALGRVPAVVGTPLGHVVFAIGMLVVSIALGLLYGFTWRVFRPDDMWAKVAVAVCCATLIGAGIWVGYQSSLGTTLEEMLPRTRQGGLLMIVLTSLQFAWSGVESTVYYRMLSRRVTLGLADPVVANRFLLWSVSSIAVALLCGSLAICFLANMVIMREALPLALMSASGMISGASWYLAFFPPQGYAKWLRSRAARSDPPPGPQRDLP